jgi:hypothetical protein
MHGRGTNIFRLYISRKAILVHDFAKLALISVVTMAHHGDDE